MSAATGWIYTGCLTPRARGWPHKGEGHGQGAQRAHASGALVCFEASGGQEWRLCSTCDTAGIAARQLPPAQIDAFAASRGTQARTERIDVELIARFMMFRPDAKRVLPHEKLRLLGALTSRRGQWVETRKRLLARIKAHGTPGSAEMPVAMNAGLKGSSRPSTRMMN